MDEYKNMIKEHDIKEEGGERKMLKMKINTYLVGIVISICGSLICVGRLSWSIFNGGLESGNALLLCVGGAVGIISAFINNESLRKMKKELALIVSGKGNTEMLLENKFHKWEATDLHDEWTELFVKVEFSEGDLTELKKILESDNKNEWGKSMLAEIENSLFEKQQRNSL
jgi:hypothetical protein